MAPGEPVREFYRMQGRLDEQKRIIELIENSQAINSDQRYFLLQAIKASK
jgi:hypothetical protein